jgi:arabinogalactan endo-1,4-beta-galactosidase
MRSVGFDSEGKITNYKALMNGVPYVCKDLHNKANLNPDGTGYIDFYWERETLVFVPQPCALTVFKNSRYDGCYYGEFLLKEKLSYNLSSCHKPNMHLHYILERTSNSIKLEDFHVMGSIKEPIEYVQEAMRQGEQDVRQAGHHQTRSQ